MVKKIWHFLQANSNAIIVVELVIIISLVIKHYNVKLINDTLIPIVYLVSIFYIYKAFKENQKSNVIEVGNLIYRKYSEEIQNIVKWLDKIEPKKHEFNNNHMSVLLKSNDYQAISDKTIKAIKIIQNTPEFKEFNERICNSDETLKQDMHLIIRNIVDDYTAMRNILSDFCGHVARLMIIYENMLVLKDSLAKEHIYFLCNELDKYLKEYYKLCESILETNSIINVNAMIQVIQIKENAIGTFSEAIHQRLFSKVYPSNFLRDYHRIIEIKTKLNFKS